MQIYVSHSSGPVPAEYCTTHRMQLQQIHTEKDVILAILILSPIIQNILQLKKHFPQQNHIQIFIMNKI